VLVAELLKEIAALPRFHVPTPPGRHPQLPHEDTADALARASVQVDAAAPTRPSNRTAASQQAMDFKVDFGDTSGFQTRGKAKKKKATTTFSWDDGDGNNNNGDGTAGGDGGEGTGGAGGGDGAGGAGGDDGQGGGDDDWTTGFTSAKDKKKNKKKQEEEQKKKDEEEAAANNTLNWADDTNDANADDDWTNGFVSKDKKKKKKVSWNTNLDYGQSDEDGQDDTAFQDVSLDDGAPKLEFSFGGGDSKKDSFGAWGQCTRPSDVRPTNRVKVTRGISQTGRATPSRRKILRRKLSSVTKTRGHSATLVPRRRPVSISVI
jgi:hypothetical protein